MLLSLGRNRGQAGEETYIGVHTQVSQEFPLPLTIMYSKSQNDNLLISS